MLSRFKFRVLGRPFVKKIQKIVLVLALALIPIFYYALINTSAQSIYGVKYSVEYAECSKDFPLKVTIKNDTFKTLQSTSFYITASPHGYSTTKYFAEHHWEKIIKSFNTETLCYRVIDSDISLKDLNLSIKRSSSYSESFD